RHILSFRRFSAPTPRRHWLQLRPLPVRRPPSLAAHGVTGARDILGGRDGFVRRVAERPLWFVFSGYGSAWLTDSLCFKLYPGCAYIDTAVDALDTIQVERGAPFAADEIAEIRCASNYLTSGMELLSIRYGDRVNLSPITVNFSVALSLA